MTKDLGASEHQTTENIFDRIKLFFNDSGCPLADSNQQVKEWQEDLLVAINEAETEFSQLVECLSDTRHLEDYIDKVDTLLLNLGMAIDEVKSKRLPDN